MKRRNWTREELILAYNGYCKIPYGRFNNRSKEVKELANLIGRSPGAVAFKLVNFVSLDPEQKKLGRKGATNIGKLDKIIFEEFQDNFDEMFILSEDLLTKKQTKNIQFEEKNIDVKVDLEKEGREILRITKSRKNQDYFRRLVMSNYSKECAITGIKIPSLLIASHIKPWSVDKKNRLNPHNGICLSATFDKAFDRGLVTINQDYKIIYSQKLKDFSSYEFYEKTFKDFENIEIKLPLKFLPNKHFLEYHNQVIFNSK